MPAKRPTPEGASFSARGSPAESDAAAAAVRQVSPPPRVVSVEAAKAKGQTRGWLLTCGRRGARASDVSHVRAVGRASS
jgi:hypothetical protein